MSSNELQKIKNILLEHEKRISRLEELFESKPEAVKKEISINEFLLEKKPKKDVQKTLVIGYYLGKYRNMSCFSAKELEEGFREAKQKVPPNINDKINLNIKKGHMMEAAEEKDGLKAWKLTDTGEKFVERGLKNN